MIPRYERKEISQIWEDNHKFETYLKVELAIMRSLEGHQIPKGVVDKIQGRVLINPRRIEEIEQVTRHDVIAFCTSITEQLEDEESRFFHYGVTSSDVIDTSFTLMIKESLDQVLPVFEGLLKSLHAKALEYKDQLCMGRSHGMYAEPLSFGQKLLGHYCEFSRRYQDLTRYYGKHLTGQFSGAVGNYTILTAEQEEMALKDLGLKVEPVSTQVIPRDRIAKLVAINALTAAAIERLAVEIRHLHRSEVGEVHEGFKKGQKGSSTMPHKKNPISAENLTGMSRTLRSHMGIALENVSLWHERDISHSSAERMYLPDNLGLLLYSLDRLRTTVEDLVVHGEVLEAKVEQNHTYLSSYYMHQLLAKSPLPREEIYPVLQRASFESEKGNNVDLFIQVIKNFVNEKNLDLDIQPVSKETLKNMYLGQVDNVFKRSLDTYPVPN